MFWETPRSAWWLGRLGIHGEPGQQVQYDNEQSLLRRVARGAIRHLSQPVLAHGRHSQSVGSHSGRPLPYLQTGRLSRFDALGLLLILLELGDDIEGLLIQGMKEFRESACFHIT